VDDSIKRHDPEPAFAEREALRRAGNSHRLLSEVVAIVLEECPKRLAAIHESCAARDSEAARRAAHSLKGAVTHLGAKKLAQVLQAIENGGRSGDWDTVSALLPDADEGWSALVRELEAYKSRPNPASAIG
jgi:two-component system, sensor histidine kinase and response regulator